jgi:hypothetical protein
VVGALDLEADEDLAKINALVIGCFEMAVVVRQCPVWAVSAEDALRISRPLNDCLKQYPQVAQKLLNIAPPVALGIGLASTIGPRVIADKVWHDMHRKPEATPVGSNPPPEQHPSVPYVTVPSDHKGTETGFPKDLEAIRAAYEAANPPEVTV